MMLLSDLIDWFRVSNEPAAKKVQQEIQERPAEVPQALKDWADARQKQLDTSIENYREQRNLLKHEAKWISAVLKDSGYPALAEEVLNRYRPVDELGCVARSAHDQ